MILKPFMLRRVKKDVQNELGDKVPPMDDVLNIFVISNTVFLQLIF